MCLSELEEKNYKDLVTYREWIPRSEFNLRENNQWKNQNRGVSRLCPSSGILKSSKHNVLETGSISILR
jgi:hypothetical protein